MPLTAPLQARDEPLAAPSPGAARRVYSLRGYPEEVIAVAFAKTSRSPDPFDAIAKDLSAEASAKFHERWVVGYGHASVAEHAVHHIAFENVSRLAVEAIESNRLGSYTEKSTRYQRFDSYYTPEAISRSAHARRYRAACDLLFTTYHRALAAVQSVIEARTPRKEGEEDRPYQTRIRSQYIDVCRYLLPTATYANLGMTANARTMEHAIAKLLSHPLQEVREIGEETKRECLHVTPTLVKYAERNTYRAETPEALAATTAVYARGLSRDGDIALVEHDPDAEERVIAAAMFRAHPVAYGSARERVRAMSPAERQAAIDEAMRRLGPHDTPIRELESAYLTFDVLVDQGAYFDLKRNRMMTQIPQALGTDYGYAVPRAIVDAGMERPYRDAIDEASATFEAIRPELPEESRYVLTNAHLRRVLMKMNLRELYYFVRLRGAPKGHFAYRIVALRCGELARERYPLIGPYLIPAGWPSAKELRDKHLA